MNIATLYLIATIMNGAFAAIHVAGDTGFAWVFLLLAAVWFVLFLFEALGC